LSEPSYESDEQPGWDSGYIPGNEGNVPSSEDFGVVLNHIDTIADGRYGAPLSPSFEYVAASAKTANIKYYFSSDAAGNVAVTAEQTVSVAFSAGTHTQTILRLSYPVSTAKYMVIYLEDDPDEKIISNQFDSVLVTLTSIAHISSQTVGEAMTPQPTFNFTVAGGDLVITIYWSIRNASGSILISGSQSFTFVTGQTSKTFSGVNMPVKKGRSTFRIGFSAGSQTIISNEFFINI